MIDISISLTSCRLCPKKCSVNRTEGATGFCGAGPDPVVAHYGLHFGEEPPISGSRGSGTVFFSPCNLRCVFCQNYQISHGLSGEKLTSEGLAAVFLELERRGAHNINLVSPTPYVPQIAGAITAARAAGLRIPFVYNTSAYEEVETIEPLEGLIDVYLPDFKYWNSSIAKRFSAAPHYRDVAAAAISEMKRQVGDLVVEDGVAKRGLLIRHLVLPAGLAGSRQVITWIAERLGPRTALSLMSQYHPACRAGSYPILNRRVRHDEYDPLVRLLEKQGFNNVFLQELESADVFLPDFRKRRPFEMER
jgi:putative pyruvate formate lyase activating enzyme